MLHHRYEGQRCSLAKTLEIVGERWTLLIIRDAFLGLRRFEQFQQSLGLARNILTDRLSTLVASGILERTRYSEHPPRHEYRLTQKGDELFVALAALRQWGDKYLTDKPSRMLRARSDRRLVLAALVPKGAAVLRADDVELVPVPGARS